MIRMPKKLISKTREESIISSAVKNKNIVARLKESNLMTIESFTRMDAKSLMFLTLQRKAKGTSMPSSASEFKKALERARKWQQEVLMVSDIQQVNVLYPKLQTKEVTRLKQNLVSFLSEALKGQSVQALSQKKDRMELVIEGVKALHLTCSELKDRVMHLWWDTREVYFSLSLVECVSPFNSLKLSPGHDLESKIRAPINITPLEIVASLKEYLKLTKRELNSKAGPKTADLQKAWSKKKTYIDPCLMIVGQSCQAAWPIEWFCGGSSTV